MTRSKLPFPFLRRGLLLAALLGLLSTPVAALAQAVGTIAGRVIDPQTKTAVAGVRVSVVDTSRETYTDQQGTYILVNVAAGSAAVHFDYVGYPLLTKTIAVVEGQRVQLDAELGQTSEVVKLEEYTVTSDVIGSARATNLQRAAPALTNIIASDLIGQLPDKNVAEALQRVPGVDIARDKGEGRFVIIRGMDPIYGGVSVNGIRMSTAEKGTREVELDVMSSTFLASIEVNKVNTADMDPDDMGGSVNIKTRSGFDQQGTQGMVSIGTNYAHQEDRHGGYNGAANYASTFFGGKLGVAVDVAADARPFTSYTEPVTTWSQVKSPTDGALHWIDNSQDFRHYDAKRWRQGIATALDYKLSDTAKIWVRFLDSSYTEKNQQWLTTFPFGAGTVQALTDTTATVSIKANGIIKSESQIVNNKRVSSLVGGFDDTIGSWTNNLKVGYTTGKYTRPTLVLAYANTTATVVNYAFNGPYDNTVTQVSGPSIDSPSSYAFSTKSAFSSTGSNMHEETVRDDLRDDFTFNGLPAFVKIGGQYRQKNNNLDTSKWAITSSPLTFANIVYPGNDIQYTMGSFPNFQIRQEAVQSFYQNQSSFGQTLTAATTYGGAFQSLEEITAGYVMGGVTMGKLKMVAGVREEDTSFNIKGWQFNATTSVATPVSSSKDYDNALPSVVFTYEFSPKTIARASWSETLVRPDYSATAPGRAVDDNAKTVTQGNSQLNALKALNWDASIEHYYSPLGVVSAAAFYKSITNFTYQNQSGFDPATGYLLTTFFNGPSASIYGIELNWAQQLGFLPAPFKGFGVQINAVFGDSKASYPTRPGEDLQFPGFAHKAGNAAITYGRNGLNLRLAAHYHGERLESGSTIGVNAQQDQYEASYVSIDFGSSYTFRQHWQIYLNGANLNNAPLKEYYGGTGSLVRLQTYESYGWSAESGIRWNY